MTTPPADRHRRDPARTRRALLDGAFTAVLRHGAGVSVDVVARTAGVSKSGLLHHFGSKEGLFTALAEDSFERFRRQVEAAVAPADLAPGRVMRGYLRAVFAEAGTDGAVPEYWAVVAHLTTTEAVAEAARADSAAWQERLTADGFDRDAMQLILLAATGGELAGSIGIHGGGDPARLRDRLIRLTYRADALRELLTQDAPG